MKLMKITETIGVAALACAAGPAHADFIVASVERSVRVATQMFGFGVPGGSRLYDSTISGPASGPWTEVVEHDDTLMEFSVHARGQQTSLVSGDAISASATALASRSLMPSSTYLTTDVRATSRLLVRFELTVPTLVEIELSGSTLFTGEYDYAARSCGVFYGNGTHILWMDEGVPSPLRLVTILPAGEYLIGSYADAWHQNSRAGPAESMERMSNASIRIVPAPGIASAILPAAAILGMRRRRHA